MITHKAGELIALSSGEYSDYRFNGLFRTLGDIDLVACAYAYFDQAPVYAWDPEDKNVSDSGFGAWLIVQGYAEEVEYNEIHCGHQFDARAVAVSARRNAAERFIDEGAGESK